MEEFDYFNRQNNINNSEDQQNLQNLNKKMNEATIDDEEFEITNSEFKS